MVCFCFTVKAASLPKYGGTLYLSLLTDPTSLDPLKILLPSDQELCRLLYDTLVGKDAEGNVVPHLAKSWATSSDGKVLTFTLRKGTTFHNGQEITSHDVVYSLKRALLKGTPSKIMPLLGDVVGASEFINNPAKDLTGILAVGDYSVQIALKQLNYNFLDKLTAQALAIVPANEVMEKGEDFFLAPSGSGPFQFASWERQRRIVLNANENYVFGRPYVDQLDFSIIGDPGAGILKFELQELDIYAIPSLDYQRFRNNQLWRDQIIESPELRVFFVGINCRKAPFVNPQARKALNYAIDRQSIIDILLAGQGEIAEGVLPGGVRKTIPSPKPFPYDPEFARKLLLSSVAADDMNRGIILWTPNDPPELVRIAERIQVNLLDLGINVFLQEKSWAEIYRGLQPSAVNEKPHLFLLSYEALSDNALDVLTDLFASKGASNLFNYHSEKVDELLTLAKQVTGLGERFDMLAEVEALVVDSAPGIFLYNTNNRIIRQPKVQDLELDLSQLKLNKLWLRQ